MRPHRRRGLAAADVEAAIGRALAAMPPPETRDQRRGGRADSAGRGGLYTGQVLSRRVHQVLRRQGHQQVRDPGLDATLAYYNREESIDGQWYVFIIDENDLVIGHPDPGRLGLDLKGWVGIDGQRLQLRPEMLAATGDGKWVSYVYRNPESGGLGIDFDHLELKNVWVVQHDGLLFRLRLVHQCRRVH